jgi:hypothetical protein
MDAAFVVCAEASERPVDQASMFGSGETSLSHMTCAAARRLYPYGQSGASSGRVRGPPHKALIADLR